MSRNRTAYKPQIYKPFPNNSSLQLKQANQRELSFAKTLKLLGSHQKPACKKMSKCEEARQLFSTNPSVKINCENNNLKIEYKTPDEVLTQFSITAADANSRSTEARVICDDTTKPVIDPIMGIIGPLLAFGLTYTATRCYLRNSHSENDYAMDVASAAKKTN